jgi:hypothetical protein
MRIRSSRISALAVGILVTGALTGITGAQSASAASWTYLCAVNPIDSETPGCMLSNGIG